ncbi:unnamed protein product [Fusarium graminearum]|uniref:Uncharacterized protein n=1 Tax=Gibberella zeae TaxID=5518 RepID=A0A4U9EXG7_GIBZA|nr:unnamed protein product [Fusarium graminearum]CAG1974948.1 unnamed protein product [Fusarium graminearum]CAG1977968.1 unnamed protein product [Fusarium graminearum]CAG2014660.1 unnamed protein product [Fusarium graminearum]VTO87186.1 unnamed protein product [Fusarium graminearum]
MDHQLVASPWFRFLINLLKSPVAFFPQNPAAERGQLISDAIQVFLKSGASLESIFPAMITFKDHLENIVLADYAAFSPEDLSQNYIALALNAMAVIDLIRKTNSLAWLQHNAEGESDCLAAGSYIKVLAFKVGGQSSLSVTEDGMIPDGFVKVLLIAILYEFSPHRRKWYKTLKAFHDVLGIWPPTCPLVKDDYYWRRILSRVVDNWPDGDHNQQLFDASFL